MRLLLANPNTSQAVTDLVAERARATARPDTEVVAVTAAFGARVIGTRAELAVAEHAALDLIARHAAGCDAVVVAASTDSGVRAARELLEVPVLGLTESALHVACLAGARFGTLTLTARSNATLRDQIEASGLGGRCVASRFIDATPRELLTNPDSVLGTLAETVALLVEDGADSVVLVGGVLAGMSERIAAEVPLVEGVSAAVALAEAMARLALPKARAGGYASVVGRAATGLSPELTALLWSGT